MTNAFNTVQLDSNRWYRAWTVGVPWEDEARFQAERLLGLDFVREVAVMPDTHFGKGGPVGIAAKFKGAICPAVVGVDIGCGMKASLLTNVWADSLTPEVLPRLRAALEAAIPTGITSGVDRGSWTNPPPAVEAVWETALRSEYARLCDRFAADYDGALGLPALRGGRTAEHNTPHLQLGTMGSGNHFFEVSTDQHGRVWLVVHSGSRGAGARIGDYFTRRAQDLMEQWHAKLPGDDKNLAFLPVGTPEYQGYLDFMRWAQKYAFHSRNLMMWRALTVALPQVLGISPYEDQVESFDIHHNWLEDLGDGNLVARKGAVKLLPGGRSIIPGAMGARTYIVQGLPGLAKSMLTCSHGAGRAMSRTAACRDISLETHQKDLAGLECDRSADTLDETIRSYKDVDAVIAAQSDLVEPLLVLNAKVCVKGITNLKKKWRKA